MLSKKTKKIKDLTFDEFQKSWFCVYNRYPDDCVKLFTNDPQEYEEKKTSISEDILNEEIDYWVYY